MTLLEMLISVLLVSFLSLGMLLTIRTALGALERTNAKLFLNRRVASVDRILEQQVAGLMPVPAECGGGGRIGFFQGEPQTMRFVSSYSLQESSRGLPRVLEYQVIPGEKGGVRLIVNEYYYAGPRSLSYFCLSAAPSFRPVEIGPQSFVLADKLAICQFQYREILPPNIEKWTDGWNRPGLPSAVRVIMNPIAADASRLPLLSKTMLIHVNRNPLLQYGDE